ncbi:hypothetical protein DRQ25_06360 [Candidatus Fermentibacteria bacterium]|nr:MAG: hypothetical protein DRQ25_06360 [Candidatus Fermentibacteria bacterium]
MNCPDFDTLMMLLDGELEEERSKDVSEHLRHCSRCRSLIDSQRNLETSWRDSFVTPEEDKFRIMEWIIYRRINRRARWKFFVPAVAGIIAVLLGVKLIIDNEPFKGRITELSREGRTEYESYTLRLDYVQEESTISNIDGFDPEETDSDGSISAPVEELLSAEDVSGETISESVGYGITEVELAVLQPAAEEDGLEAALRGTSSIAQEADQMIAAGGEALAGGAGGSGSAGLGGLVNEEECEETELPGEIVCSGAVEGICPEEQMDDMACITLSTDADTAVSVGSETVPSSTGVCEDTEDNIGWNQSSDYYSRYHDTSEHDIGDYKAENYVELVFDAGGQPDSSTALLLDSLFASWSDYIPSIYRDTVLVVPMAGIQEFFEEGSTVPVQTIE